MPDFSSIIDGRPPASEASEAAVNPADGTDRLGDVALVGGEEFVTAARVAQREQPAWAAVPGPRRGEVLAAAAAIVESRLEEISALIVREVGKPIAQAGYEAAEIAKTCRAFAAESGRVGGQLVPSSSPETDILTYREPLGAVAVVTPVLYPAAVPIWSIAPALACGNGVVWKASVEAAGVASALFEILAEAGVPEGLLNLVLASDEATAAGLASALEEGLVDKVSFTGSTAVGREIGALCGRYLQVPCLELSGNNVAVVADDADLGAAVEGVLRSGFGVNQGCTTLGTAIVHDDVYETFLARLDEAVTGAPIGDPTRPEVLYGPMQSVRFGDRFEQLLGLLEPHHELRGSSAAGRISAANPRAGFVGDPEAGAFYHPSIVTGVRRGDEILRHEALGPLLRVYPYGSFDEAVEFAAEAGGGLLASIYTGRPGDAFAFRQRVPVGITAVNRPPSLAGETRAPFGGVGSSGNGARLSGPWSIDQFSRWQAMSWSHPTTD